MIPIKDNYIYIYIYIFELDNDTQVDEQLVTT